MSEQSHPAPTPSANRRKLGIILFPGFETLDVFGPVQMWGRLPDHEIVTVSQSGGLIASSQGVETNATYAFAETPQLAILMIPGGMGVRTEIDNPAMIEFIARQDGATDYTASVCTGAALLAKAGLLRGRRATTNKQAWRWVTGQAPDVIWQPRARWVVDGKYVTSSGVSAGTDMALGLVELIYGRERAEGIARDAEYVWNSTSDDDPFAV